MKKYTIQGETIDSIELKCLVVSRGVRVEKAVYSAFTKSHRLSQNPLTCNCFHLSDKTIVQLTDMSFHLNQIFQVAGMVSSSDIKALKGTEKTPFSISLKNGNPQLLYNDVFVDDITFLPKNDFYAQKTSSSLPFLGNAVLQGTDWVSFQCLWPCEYGACNKGCEFCFTGTSFAKLAKGNKSLPQAVDSEDVAEIVNYAFSSCGCNSVQITGGSTFSETKEHGYIKGYLEAINEKVGRVPGELLLYITPPANMNVIDEYFKLGAARIACSLELWDENLARRVTPGKIDITTRQRHLKALEYIAGHYGKGRAFSNFIIGIESFETLKEGSVYLAQRGIIPTASIWMPMGRPVNGSVQPPDLDYYRRVKDLFAELYCKYDLEPACCSGLNVCMERDIWNYSQSTNN